MVKCVICGKETGSSYPYCELCRMRLGLYLKHVFGSPVHEKEEKT